MLRKCALILVVVALPWTNCFSQQTENGRNRVGRMPLMMAITGLGSPAIRQELKLTDAQEEKIKSSIEKVTEARASFSGIPRPLKPSKEEREVRLEGLRKVMKAKETANDEVTAVLTKEQLARFHQIRLWIGRDIALLSQEVITELKLVSVQTDALAAIDEKHQKKLAESPRFSGTREEIYRKAQEWVWSVNKDFGEEYFSVLTEDQRDQFEKMCGPEFKVDRWELRTPYSDPGKSSKSPRAKKRARCQVFSSAGGLIFRPLPNEARSPPRTL